MAGRRSTRRHRDEFECWYHGASQLGEQGWREVTAHYYAYSRMIDDQVARLLDELDRLGLAGSTAVIYTADHGNLCGARMGLYDKGVGMFEDTYHIPMFVRWPGFAPPGQTRDHLVSNMDVFPTILDIAGADIPGGLDSRSLLPVLTDPSAAWRDDLMSWSSGTYYLHSQRMLRWKDYKYVFTPYDTDELYDLHEDPLEMNNRIDAPALREAKTEIRRRLIANARQANDPLAYVMQGYFRT